MSLNARYFFKHCILLNPVRVYTIRFSVHLHLQQMHINFNDDFVYVYVGARFVNLTPSVCHYLGLSLRRYQTAGVRFSLRQVLELARDAENVAATAAAAENVAIRRLYY